MDFLESFHEYTGNTIGQVLLVCALIVGSLILGRVAKYWFKVLADKTSTEDKQGRITTAFFEALSEGVTSILLAVGITLSIKALTLTGWAAELGPTLADVALVLAVAHNIYLMIDVLGEYFRRRAEASESKLDDMLVPIVVKGLRIALALLVVLHIATILTNKPPTSIVAGLGISGLAIAFAAQDTIKNLFGSVMILADKPFEIGDRIAVDGHDGPVKSVGLRSTRIANLEGHIVTIPNGRLADMTIRNVSERPNIRRLMNISITYDTKPEKIEEALAIVRELLKDHEGMHEDFPPRVYFNDLASHYLNIMAIYWYHPADWWAYCAFSEKFNIELIKRFNAAGIEFAFPTQTLFLAGDEKRPLGGLGDIKG